MATVLEILSDFVEKHGQAGVQSTGSKVVTYSGTLYNVIGSTSDPKIGGSWKTLLTNNGIGTGSNNHCYVTNNTNPGGSSHPQFDVGGHVTPNSSGSVATGGTCYLMPLCSAHNGHAQDHTAFSHPSKILQLTGYMQGELAETFMARLPSEEPLSIIYESVDGWKNQSLSADEWGARNTMKLHDTASAGLPPRYVIFRKEIRNGEIFHVVEASNLTA